MRNVLVNRPRFIPKSLLGLFEKTAWPIVDHKDRTLRPPGPKIDIAAQMKSMWR